MERDAFHRLVDRRVLLLDGGMGSLLIAGGLKAGRAPEWWVLEHPERISVAHRSYASAGADVIHAVTFGANPVKLTSAGLDGRCEEINRRAVALAREACEPSTLVAGDIGPTGKFYPPLGDASDDRLVEAFRAQVAVLVDAGVDLLAIETMYDVREARAAVIAARESELPVLASMTFDQRRRGFFTLIGDRIGEALASLVDTGADAVGFNCSVTSEPMVAMVCEARSALAAPLIAQPNAGQPRVTAEGVVYDADPDQFAADLLRMVEHGARVVGGCCGTDPAFIATARAALDAGDAA